MVDVLTRLILKGVEGNIIEPFRVGGMKWHYLTFSLWTILCYFCSGKEKSFFILNHMVGFFENMSGLKINRNKCQILGNSDSEKFGRWVEVFGCEVGTFPSSYFGVPLGGLVNRELHCFGNLCEKVL